MKIIKITVICDKCYKAVPPEVLTRNAIHIEQGMDMIDLCPECQKKLDDWIWGGKNDI